jgi:hypothetical protein
VRLIDVVFRRGHLSERALIDALTGGERPSHLDRCDLCAERADALGRWLDGVQQDGVENADAVFTTEQLAAQQTQILRRLEQLDSPARVIAFPASSRAERETGGRRVAASWVGIAAAAGLVIGIAGGQFSARLAQRPATAPLVVDNVPVQPPVDAQFLEQSYDQLSLSPFEVLDEMTPRLTQVSARSGGRPLQ